MLARVRVFFLLVLLDVLLIELEGIRSLPFSCVEKLSLAPPSVNPLVNPCSSKECKGSWGQGFWALTLKGFISLWSEPEVIGTLVAHKH